MLCSLFPRGHARYSTLPIVGRHLEGLCEWLSARGYPRDALRRRVESAPFLDARLRSRGVDSLEELTAQELRDAAPKPTRWSAQLAGALARSLADYLAASGSLRAPVFTRTERELAKYTRYLAEVRGLAPKSIGGQTSTIGRLLAFLGHEADATRLGRLDVADLDTFVAAEGRRVGRVSMQKVVASLRSFVRFLAIDGRLAPGLETCIESPRLFRGERPPRALPWDSVVAVLEAVDRTSPKGLRDYAMLLLVATYGLRRSEVAALRLDDIAWRARQMRVPRSKVGTSLSLPLTDEVATALLDYLRRGRPESSERAVFLRVRAPAGPVRACAVSDVFDLWAARAGVALPAGRGGPHTMRHAIAMDLLRRGTAVGTIGGLLGHRTVESTSVYLRLHVEDLRGVALPLPRAAESES